MTGRKLMIAAPSSGSGKTTITCAILQALKTQGETVRSFKCGPDYIDPMFHQTVLGIPSRNLDSWFVEPSMLRNLYYQDSTDGQITVVEGVMGLYDGIGGIHEDGSAYHLATIFKIPIVLVLDAHGMGRTMLTILDGIMKYDRCHLIRGIILNRTSKMFAEVMKPLIENQFGIKVLGCFPKQQETVFSSRHLGLVMPDEIMDIRRQLDQMTAELMKNVDMKALYDLAEIETIPKLFPHKKTAVTVPLAVARDEAFCFYYEDNLRMLQDAGAEIAYFSPIHDQTLPKGCQGILLGGGYPELYARLLSDNTSMKAAIREAVSNNMPIVAECGGFMYLHETLTDQSGHRYPMVGAVKGDCHYTGRLVRFGYTAIMENTPDYLPEGSVICGHEFHYYDSDDNGDDCMVYKPYTERKWESVHREANGWWGYPHLYYPSNPKFVDNFIKKAKQWGINT